MRSQLSFEPQPFIRPPSRRRVYICPFRESRAKNHGTRLTSESTYSWKSPWRSDCTHYSNSRVIDQNWNWGLLDIMSDFQFSNVGTHLHSALECQVLYAFCIKMYRLEAVTWCTCLLRDTWVPFRNDCAVPADAILTFVHPLSSNQPPIVLNAAISICIPPSIMTHLSSPCVSDQFHCISLAIVYSGWSKAMTGFDHDWGNQHSAEWCSWNDVSWQVFSLILEKCPIKAGFTVDMYITMLLNLQSHCLCV